MKDISAKNKPFLYLLNVDGKNACKAYKDSLPNEIINYLSDISAKRLNYYAKPPSLDSLFANAGIFAMPCKTSCCNNHQYFVCMSAKCISQTAAVLLANFSSLGLKFAPFLPWTQAQPDLIHH